MTGVEAVRSPSSNFPAPLCSAFRPSFGCCASLPWSSSLANPRINDSRNSLPADEKSIIVRARMLARPGSPTRLEGCYDLGVRGCREIASLSDLRRSLSLTVTTHNIEQSTAVQQLSGAA